MVWPGAIRMHISLLAAVAGYLAILLRTSIGFLQSPWCVTTNNQLLSVFLSASSVQIGMETAINIAMPGKILSLFLCTVPWQYVPKILFTRPDFFCDPVVSELICYHTRANQLISEGNMTGGLRKIVPGTQTTIDFFTNTKAVHQKRAIKFCRVQQGRQK